MKNTRKPSINSKEKNEQQEENWALPAHDHIGQLGWRLGAIYERM